MDSGEREEMTAAAIARLAGVGRAAVSNWRRRYPEFPKPVGGSSTSPTFDRAEIEAWLKDTGKADQLATAGQTDTGTQRISEPERSITDLQPGDLLARSMAALLPRETAAAGTAEDEGEPEAFPDAPDDLPVVLDPACGTATALLAVADRFGDRVRLAGQEINQAYARTARFNLSGNANGAAYEVARRRLVPGQPARSVPGQGRGRRVRAAVRLAAVAGDRADHGSALGVRHPGAARRRTGLGPALLRAPAAAGRRRCRRVAADLRAAIRRGDTRSPGPFGSIAGRDRPAAGHDVRTRHGPLPVAPAAALRRAGPRAGADDRPVRPR